MPSGQLLRGQYRAAATKNEPQSDVSQRRIPKIRGRSLRVARVAPISASGLSLRELLAATCLTESDFLALDFARIARYQAGA